MPVDTRSYDGVVNFNYQPVDTENDKMSVAFTVQEEGSEVLLGNVMAFHDYVAVYLSDVNGKSKDWNGLADLQFDVICFGARSSGMQ